MNTLKNASLKKIKNLLQLSSLNTPAKASVYLTGANLIAKGASLIFTPIFTRLLSSSEYGEYSLFSSYLSLALVIITLEIPGSVIMRAFQKKRGAEHTSLLTAAVIPLLLALPVIILLRYFSKNGGLTFPFAYVFLFFSAVSSAFINLFVSKCKFVYNWRTPLILALIQSILTPVLSILLINTDYLKSYNHVSVKIATATGISALIASVLFIFSVKRAFNEKSARKSGPLKYSKELLPSLLKLALPLLPYYFSVMLISQADKFFISYSIGKEALGKYSVAFSAGIALTALSGGVMNALVPWIMRKVRAEEFEALRYTLTIAIKLMVPIIMIFLCFAPEVFAFLAPEEYRSALPVLYIAAIIPLPLAISQSLCCIAVAKEKTTGVLMSGLFCAFETVSLNLLTLSHKNILIPALIAAVGYISLLVCGLINTKNILSKSPINANKTFQIILFLSFISSVIYTFRNILIIRFAIFFAALATLLYMLKSSIWLLRDS